MKLWIALAGVLLLVVVQLLGGAFYTVHETDTVILTQFGGPVGDPVTEPGLHFKTPFVQKVNRLEKRVLEESWQNTFGRWSDSDWKTFDNLYRRSLD